MKKIRFRDIYMFIGGVMMVILYIIIDPDSKIIQHLPFGASTVVMLAQLLKTIWFVGMMHMSRRALLDYLDIEKLIVKAEQTPEGAGSVMIGVGLIYIAVAILMTAAVISN